MPVSAMLPSCISAGSKHVDDEASDGGTPKSGTGKDRLKSLTRQVKSIKEFGIGASPVMISPRLVGDTTAKLNAEPTQSSNTQNAGSNDVKNGADALSADNASGSGSEQVTEDDPGVYVTVKVLPGGSKVLKRVRFSRDRFNELQAKLWWDKNRFRIHEQYVREPTRGTSFRSM